MSKTTLIKEIAKNLVENDRTMTYDQLANHLNDIGHKTTYGTEYQGSRGVARLISTVYQDVSNSGDNNGAENIANAFTDNNGNHPWRK